MAVSLNSRLERNKEEEEEMLGVGFRPGASELLLLFNLYRGTSLIRKRLLLRLDASTILLHPPCYRGTSLIRKHPPP